MAASGDLCGGTSQIGDGVVKLLQDSRAGVLCAGLVGARVSS